MNHEVSREGSIISGIDNGEPRDESPVIQQLQRCDLDRLRPLWLELHAHHVLLAPTLAGLKAEAADESWRRRRSRYVSWLRDPDTFVLVAARDAEFIGYAFVTVNDGFSSWRSGDRIGELQTLCVASAWRHLGVGSQLVAAFRRVLSRRGIRCVALSALAANTDAHHFYERLGFVQTEVSFVAQVAT